MIRSQFHSSRTRIGWAKENIAKFEKRAELFFRRTSHITVIEADSDGVHDLHKFRLAKTLPPILTEHTVSAVENLRSALDLAAVAVGHLCNVPDANIHFPFCKSSSDIKSRVNGACKNLPNEIKALFSSFQPYRGGNDLLWAINELCNTSKHRLIYPVAAQGGVRFPYIETFDAYLPIELMEGVHDCAENEVLFARTQRDLKWKYHVQIAFAIGFGRVEALQGKEVYPTLLQMHEIVTNIIGKTEDQCCRLGLISTS